MPGFQDFFVLFSLNETDLIFIKNIWSWSYEKHEKSSSFNSIVIFLISS
jgi:hypothetical protein